MVRKIALATVLGALGAAFACESHSTTATGESPVAASTVGSTSTSTTPATSAGTGTPSSPASNGESPTTTVSSATVQSQLPSGVVNETLPESSAEPLSGASVDGKILILARDEAGISSGGSGLRGYGIPYEGFVIPKEGADLQSLNSSATYGKYSGIIIMDALAYEYDDGWHSAVTQDQWATIHDYQKLFNVRMVRINEYPGPSFGATVTGGGCCSSGEDQLVSFTDTTDFPTANLKSNAGITTRGLWHYPATITDSDTTKRVAKFGPGGGFDSESTAAVINNFDGREQFVWFTSWAPEWSVTSNYLQHAHIHWMTRGLFLGKRKTHLSTQVDDLQLSTELYYPQGSEFKIRTEDLEGHIDWQNNINDRLPAGSDFWLELAHNGNGDIIAATEPDGSNGVCDPDYAVFYDEFPAPPLEWVKPIGSGTDIWPDEFAEYPWSLTCAKRDEFATWFTVAANRDAFAHLSHTFSHMNLNNATYKDTSREIRFNQDWMKQMGIDQAARYSAEGLVPPAITGLHNGDAIKAWLDAGLTNCVGDNTRAPLRNSDSQFWPLVTSEGQNGYDGLVIVPRYATTIYFNCDTAECTTREWVETSGGQGDFDDLLEQAKTDNSRYLFALHADPYMFHQANMRQIDMPTITVGSQTGKLSLIMAWVEVVAQEVVRLTNWPIRSLKQDDIAQYFLDRMALDKCEPKVSYKYAGDGKSISSVTVSANGNSCSVPVPVTIPDGTASASGGSVTNDKVGSEPPIQWVRLNGSPVTLTLSQAVPL